MANYYFDTSIWIDIYESRGQNGEFAKQLFQQIILQDDIIIYSNVVILELKRLRYSESEINSLLSITKPNHSKRVESTKIQIQIAQKIAKQKNIPSGDVLHALLAKESLSIMVSRDHDFEQVKDIVETKKPEDLLR